MGFLDELKRRQRSTPGFAGGTLEEQLARKMQQPNMDEQGGIWENGVPQGDIQGSPLIGRQPAPQPEQGGFVRPPQPTMAEQAIGRAVGSQPQPQPTTQAPPDAVMRPDAERVRTIADPRTGRPNEDFYRDRGDIQGLYNAETNWKPRGAKRGFKNSLKAGAMMAAEAVRNNPQDPVTAAIAGFGIGAAGGTAAPNFKNRLARNWKLNQVGGELKNKLELEKERAQIDQGTMVPVQLDNGETVMVPQRTAGSLRSQQQGIGLKADTLTERKRVNTDRKNRWDSMDKRDRMRNIISLYNSGGLNDPELLEYAADQLGLPAPMREKFIQGRLQGGLDADGNLININRQEGTATPITQPSPQVGTQPAGTRMRQATVPVKGFQVTQEAGRTQRAQARESRLGQPKPEKVKPLDAGTKRQIAEGIGAVERHKRALTAVDEEIKNAPQTIKDEKGKDVTNPALKRLGDKRRALVDEGAGIAATLDALDPSNETGSGTGGYIYRKSRQPSDLSQPIYGTPTTKPTGRTIEGAVNAFKTKYKREPTADEVARMRAALGQ